VIYPVEYLVRQQVEATSFYDWTAEGVLTVRFVASPKLVFY
jgi:hypothetical protein